jgi:type IV pilus assembly protein PilW
MNRLPYSRSNLRALRLRKLNAGLSLVELMVALALGSALIAGAVYVYSQSRSTYRVSENIARLQEQGRYVISVIEPDLELAGFYGFTNSPDALRLVRDGDAGLVVATASRMRQDPVTTGGAQPPAVALPSGAHACGTNFAVDVLTTIQGSNDQFKLGPSRTSDCAPYQTGALENTDTLTVRHADPQTSTPRAGRIQVYASRFSSRSAHLLFADGRAPGIIDADNRVHDLVVRAYYVDKDSVEQAGFPALRVKTLSERGGSPTFDEDEVMPGVEDFQVQFGIDTGDYNNDGVIDAGVDVNGDGIPEADGRATRYVNPDFKDLARYQVVAVRFWVRVRSNQREPDVVDSNTYQYADTSFRPEGEQQHYRRILMSRTVTLRNARTL